MHTKHKTRSRDLQTTGVDVAPQGWRLARVGDVLEILNNLRKPISADERSSMKGPYPYYGPTKIQDWINEFGLDGEFALIGEDGDHFLKFASMSMTQLITGQFNVNNHAHVIQGTDQCTAAWFYHFFKHRDLSRFLTRQGAGRYKLNKEALEKVPLLLPPIVEQHKIATILTTWDRAIETVRRLAGNSKAETRGLTQQLVWGKKRFVSHIRSDGWKHTRLGRLPEDWHLPAIGDIAEEVSIRNMNGEDLPVLACSKHVGFVKSLEYFKKKIYSDDTSNYKMAPRGSFGFPSNHIEEGSIGYQDICDAGLVSPIYCLFRTRPSIYDNYLYRLLKTDHYRQIFSAATSSSVDRRGSLRWKEFARLHVPLPSLEEQREISECLNASSLRHDNLTRQLANLRLQRMRLMRQLLTGKVRVNAKEAA